MVQSGHRRSDRSNVFVLTFAIFGAFILFSVLRLKASGSSSESQDHFIRSVFGLFGAFVINELLDAYGLSVEIIYYY